MRASVLPASTWDGAKSGSTGTGSATGSAPPHPRTAKEADDAWMSVREAWFRVMLTVLDGYRTHIHSPFDAPAPTPASTSSASKAAASGTPQGGPPLSSISPAVPPTPSATSGGTAVIIVGGGGVTATPLSAASTPAGGVNIIRSMSLASGPSSGGHERGGSNASGGAGPGTGDAGQDARPAAIGWYDTAGFVGATKSRRLRAFRSNLVSTQSWQGYVGPAPQPRFYIA